jgi:hypothetical protein
MKGKSGMNDNALASPLSQAPRFFTTDINFELQLGERESAPCQTTTLLHQYSTEV